MIEQVGVWHFMIALMAFVVDRIELNVMVYKFEILEALIVVFMS